MPLLPKTISTFVSIYLIGMLVSVLKRVKNLEKIQGFLGAVTQLEERSVDQELETYSKPDPDMNLGKLLPLFGRHLQPLDNEEYETNNSF